MTKNVHRSSRKVPFIIVRYQLNLDFPDIFSKNPQISNLMKTRPVGIELLHAEGRPDGHEANSRFSQFRKRA